MTKIIVAGAAGRMGQALVRCSRTTDGVQLVGAVEHADHPEQGRDAGLVAGIGEIGLLVTSDLAALLPSADVVIDFTFHTAVPANVRATAAQRRAVVVGTTALTPDESRELLVAGGKVPIVWAPNMSLGVNVLFAAVKKAAAVFGGEYRVEIDETHHVHKKDAPSGTALRLGEKVAEGLQSDFQKVMVHDEGGCLDVPQRGKILVRSFREGEVVGDHTVRFISEGETIEFTHRAASRDAFAVGALKAAVWVATQRPRLYDMQDVLGL